MDTENYPRIRLLPRKTAQHIRFGAPWVFTDLLVMDRRTRGIKPGSFVVFEDNARVPQGVGTFNPNSKIGFRMMERDPEVGIDGVWLEAKISRALSLRERLYDAPYYRLIHAEADGLPGLVIDRFGSVAVIQPNAAWADVHLDMVVEALIAVTGVETIFKNAAGRARQLEGLDAESVLLRGSLEAALDVPMNGAVYKADIQGGQKTGLYFDQRPNHLLAAQIAKGGRMLDVFSHVGGFSLAALAGGATEALAVDASQAALDLASEGAQLSGVAKQFSTRKGDAFDVMAALAEEGASFEAVVCDPPAFAPAKQALEAGLRAYERVARNASQLVASDGFLVLCSCSHAADLPRFREASLRGIGKGGRRAQIVHTGTAGPDHPTHPYLAESSYLKVLFLRLD